MSATKTKVQSIIDENPVAVFSKSYCPYCRQAKQLLSDSGAKFYAIELDQVGLYTLSPFKTLLCKVASHGCWIKADGV